MYELAKSFLLEESEMRRGSERSIRSSCTEPFTPSQESCTLTGHHIGQHRVGMGRGGEKGRAAGEFAGAPTT